MSDDLYLVLSVMLEFLWKFGLLVVLACSLNWLWEKVKR